MMLILLILLLAVCVALIVCLLLIKRQNNEIAKFRCDLTDSCISAQQLLQGNLRLKTKLENLSAQSFYLCDALIRLAKDNDKIFRDILRREDSDEAKDQTLKYRDTRHKDAQLNKFIEKVRNV